MSDALKETIAMCAVFNIHEKRSESGSYFECVYKNKDIAGVEKAISDSFGPAAKPPEAPPAKEDSRLTKDHGGIFKGQTLYKKDIGDSIIIAMLWPWQDNTHTTLKVALIKK